MELDSILESHKKPIRKLKYLWPLLVNPKHFLIPETIEEYKDFGIFSPHINIEPYGECFLNEKSKLNLGNFTNTLYEIPQIRNSVSYNLIYKTTKSSIERAVSERVKHGKKADPEKEIVSLIQSLINSKTPFQFYRIVEGIKLEGIKSLMMGDVELCVYTKVYEKELQTYRKHNNERGFFDKYITPFVKKNFLNKVCIRTVVIGDSIRAEEIAIKRIKQVLNVLRFVVCILRPATMVDNRIKINLLAESFDVSESTMHVNLSENIISLSLGKTRKPFDTLPIDIQLLEELKKNCFFEDLLNMLGSDRKSELDENILTSIYWIGEAQNDFLCESAFIKCWTALETLFSVNGDGITEELARGIPILLAFGGYRFITIEKIEEVHKNVKRLYRKRSKVVHRGLYEAVNPTELVEVCKFAVWSVLICLGLRTRGYKTLEQIRTETNRLYEASSRHSRKQGN